MSLTQWTLGLINVLSLATQTLKTFFYNILLELCGLPNVLPLAVRASTSPSSSTRAWPRRAWSAPGAWPAPPPTSVASSSEATTRRSGERCHYLKRFIWWCFKMKWMNLTRPPMSSSDWDLTFTWRSPDVHLNLTWPSSDLPLTLTRPLPNLD